MAALLLVALLQADADLVARARALTSAEQRCIADPDSTDITVCGLRRADRFRTPLVVHDPGDRRYESVGAERERLLHRTTPIDDLGPFLVGGGMVGVTATVGGGDAGGVVGYRKPAP